MKHLSLREAWVGSMIPQLGGNRAGIQTHWVLSQWLASRHGRALRPHHHLLFAAIEGTSETRPSDPRQWSLLSSLLYSHPMWKNRVSPASAFLLSLHDSRNRTLGSIIRPHRRTNNYLLSFVAFKICVKHFFFQ